ncbi:MAG: nuclear transport factor 2 family protein [Pseudomonadota bacterium]
MRHKWKCVLSAALLYAEATACEPDSTAIQYLAAIDAMDCDAMRSHLAEDATYTDPTMTHFGTDAIDLTGANNVVEFWRSSSEDSGTSEIKYTITSCLETAGYHAVNLDILISVSSAYWCVNKDVIDIPGRVVSIIRVQDGRVIEHDDYVEYAAADKVVAKLREKYGEAKGETSD